MKIYMYIIFIDLITSVLYKMETENINEINRIGESLRWRLIRYPDDGKTQYESA